MNGPYALCGGTSSPYHNTSTGTSPFPGGTSVTGARSLLRGYPMTGVPPDQDWSTSHQDHVPFYHFFVSPHLRGGVLHPRSGWGYLGYPSLTRSGWGTTPRPGTGYPPRPGMGYPSRGHSEHLLRGGRYASCVHAGGLSCC